MGRGDTASIREARAPALPGPPRARVAFSLSRSCRGPGGSSACGGDLVNVAVMACRTRTHGSPGHTSLGQKRNTHTGGLSLLWGQMSESESHGEEKQVTSSTGF